jgi:hypothetical protein
MAYVNYRRGLTDNTHTAMTVAIEAITSPCIRKYCLDEQNICLDCGRSLYEITQWTRVDESTRQ